MHSQFVKIREIRGRLKIFHCLLDKSLKKTQFGIIEHYNSASGEN